MKLIIVLLLSVNISNLCSQTDWQKKNKIAFSYANGSQLFLDVNYRYHVGLIHLYYYRKLITKKKWSLDLMVNPHFGLSDFNFEKEDLNSQKGYEYGVNFGTFIHHKFIWDEVRFYGQFSVGPHYVSGAPSRQSPGFIFSDNASIGWIFNVESNTFIFIGIGIRHISNAKLKLPNGGINNTIVQAGILLTLD